MSKRSPSIEIEYCTQCRWLLRAAWTAQELLTTFQDEIGEVCLQPGTGGIFEVRIGEDIVWSRAKEQRFPEMKELKQLIRDRIAPEQQLGHSDR
jgi:selenoprotein W-related protein